MPTTQSNTYSFIYDTTAGIPAVLMERKNSETPKLYIRTPDGRLIARVTATATPTLDFYYHFDGLGSTRALTDGNGNTTDTYDYNVWGIVNHSGLAQQPYQFVGQLGLGDQALQGICRLAVVAVADLAADRAGREVGLHAAAALGGHAIHQVVHGEVPSRWLSWWHHHPREG